MSEHGKNILSHITHFHSIFYRFKDLQPNSDYVYVTPVGAFRIAYKPEIDGSLDRRGGSQALLYARHADDLAGEKVPAPDDPAGYRLRIKYLERVILLAIKNRRHSSAAAFGPIDNRLQLDCSSLVKIIPDAVQYIPRILLREASLHQIEGKYRSAHLGYHPTALDNSGLSEIDITTRIETDHGFDMTTPSRTLQMAKRNMFLRILQNLSPTLKLTLGIYQEKERRIETISSFPPGQIGSAILADAQTRINAIYAGDDPAGLSKRQVILLRRAAEVAGMKAHEFKYLLSNKKALLREALKLGLFAMDFSGSMVELAIGLILADAPKPQNIPANWLDATRAKRHVFTVMSEMNEFMLPPSDIVDEFEFLDPGKHRPSFVEGESLKPADPNTNFRYWLMSHFLAPYCTIFNYYGDFEDFGKMHSIADVQLIHGEVNNGLQLYYDNQHKTLYVYFSSENFEPAKRLLPHNAASYFKEGKVLVCDMSDFNKPLHEISFQEFELKVQPLIHTAHSPLKPPQEPDSSMINQERSEPKPLVKTLMPSI